MNKYFGIKLLWVAFGIGLATTSLSACAMSDTSRALLEIKHMKPERYFAEGVQADFVAAVGRGDLRRAEQLLGRGADVNAVGKEGMTPLFWAIGKQNLAGCRYLLTHGARPNTVTHWRNSDGQKQVASAPHLTAMLEDSAFLGAVLEAGGDPNLVEDDRTKQTPIFVAILHQRRANIDLLLKSNANINHRNLSMATPINYSVSANGYALALHLLRKGGDPTIDDRWGYNAIDTTKQFGNRGVVIGSADEKAYPEFVAELKRRGLW